MTVLMTFETASCMNHRLLRLPCVHKFKCPESRLPKHVGQVWLLHVNPVRMIYVVAHRFIGGVKNIRAHENRPRENAKQ